MKFAFLFAGILVGLLTKSQNYIVPQHQELKKRPGYYYSYNSERKTCDWIGYTLTKEDVSGLHSPSIMFHKDSSETMCASETDYGNYSYTLGLMKPRSAARNSRVEMEQVHNMLNIVPMNLELSRGSWRILDNLIAGWAVIFDSVFVVTGTIFEQNPPELVGDAKVNVPDKFFKVVLVRNGLDLGAIGFVIPNKAESNNLHQYSMPVDSLENLTGYDFFSELPDYLEGDTESLFKAGIWKDLSASYKIKSSYIKEDQCVASQKSGERCKTKTECITLNCWKHGCDLKEQK